MGVPIRKGPLERIPRSHLQPQLEVDPDQRPGRLLGLRAVLWADWGRQDLYNDWGSVRL